jgi:flagellar biosynthetic protein FlhB
MAEDSNGDKTEAPTPRRREEAREQGNIPRSPDLTAAVLLIGAMYMLRWYGGRLIIVLSETVHQMLSHDSFSDVSTARVGSMLSTSVYHVGIAMAPLLLGVMLVAILVNMAQTGLNFNPARLAFNLEALNPTRGFGRLFSGGQGLVKLGMSMLKLCLVGLMAYSAIHGRITQIILSQETTFVQIFGMAADIIFNIAIRVGILLFILSLLDYIWQRHRIEQSLKMSKQEVKDEMKSMEGDPRLKARRRQIAVARLREQLKKDVPKADVVVTNPTEFAVALQYDPNSMNAPKVVAKGQGYIAARIRQLAIENGIPILERKPLARALYKMCHVGQEVPEQYFSAIAEILAYVYELNGKFKQKHFAKAAV